MLQLHILNKQNIPTVDRDPARRLAGLIETEEDGDVKLKFVGVVGTTLVGEGVVEVAERLLFSIVIGVVVTK